MAQTINAPAAGVALPTETIITWQAPALRFGLGAIREVGYDLRRLGVSKALLVTDPTLARVGLPQQVRKNIEVEGVATEIYDEAHVEPTDASIRQALRSLEGQDYDGYVGVGGGSSIDTAKAINLSRPILRTSCIQ